MKFLEKIGFKPKKPLNTPEINTDPDADLNKMDLTGLMMETQRLRNFSRHARMEMLSPVSEAEEKLLPGVRQEVEKVETRLQKAEKRLQELREELPK